jgi:hypothetical protein
MVSYDEAVNGRATQPLPPRPLDVDPDDVAGAFAARRQLGADAELAVIADFLARTGHAIDVRVDQRVAQHRAAEQWQWRGGDRPRRNAGGLTLALGSIALGIPVTGVAATFGGFSATFVAFCAWFAIAVINIAYAIGRPR